MNTSTSVGPRTLCVLGAALISLLLAGCGQKGPLKLPEQPKPPASAASQAKA
ncbi:MAG TPA: lipoprotein [Roseateles sp.]|nr:lipoprotein [Roseateles sp.]